MDMNKKAEMPFWLVMTIITLVTMVVILIFIGLAGGKFNDFVDWLSSVF